MRLPARAARRTNEGHMKQAEVVVIGGGIVGAACADALAGRGRSVTLLEREAVCGAQASEAAAGMLGAQHDAPEAAHFPLLCEALAAWRGLPEQLREDTGQDIEAAAQRGMRLLTTDDAVEAAIMHVAALREVGFDADILPIEECVSRHPWLSRDAALGAIWLAQEHHVAAGVATRALATRAQKRGASVVVGAAVTAMERGPSGGFRVRTTGGDFEAEQVVNAAGAWAQAVAEMLGVHVPVVPVRGQMMTTPALPPLFDAVVIGDDAYFLQRPSGHVLVGATVERVGFDKSVVPGMVDALWEKARAMAPILRDVAVEDRWAGLRPGSPDGHPILGHAPGAPGFVLACGHYRNGILLGPLTGSLVADLCEGKTPALDLTPYALARFTSDA